MSAVLTEPLKRVTLWVRDVEASLALYRDALGLEVLEDKQIGGPQIARMVGLEQATLRIVHLGPRGATHGWVGLYAISNTAPRPMAALPAPTGFPLYGQATLVFTTGQMTEAVARLREVPGVRLVTEPTEYHKAVASEAMPAGYYSEVIFFDPDGVPVALSGYRPA